MSQELNLEEGASGQISEAETNSVSRKIQGIRRVTEAAQSCYDFVAKCLLDVKKILDPQRPYGYWIFLISCVMVISVDPLFFYVPVANIDKLCLGFDSSLRITSILLHSIFSIFYLTYINFILLPTDLPKIKVKSFSRFSLVDLLVVLPFPLVLLTLVIDIPKLGVTDFSYPMTLFFIQYMLRVIRIYILFTKATRISGILAEAKWAKAAFNLLLYLHGGHVFGALWYYFAVEREAICWKNLCNLSSRCSHSSFYCSNSPGNYGLLYPPQQDMCNGMEDSFAFGVFSDAIQSRIVEVTSFIARFSYCLRWGLQSLSNFGQSLQPSSFAGENIFVISITIYSLVLFVLFVGNIQTYLKSETVKLEKIRQKEQEIEHWMSSWKLSENLQRMVKKYLPREWQEMKDVDLKNLLNKLPKDISKTIKQELCLKLLKKVGESENLSATVLEALCDYVKPVSYLARTHIVREGDPIDEMLFVMQGKLRIYTSGVTKTTSPRTDHRSRKNHHLRGGEFCGEALVAWFQADPYSSSFPISTRSIQVLTNVEAFALMADDLQNFFIRHQAVHFIQLYWRFRRTWHSKRNSQTSNRVENNVARVSATSGA